MLMRQNITSRVRGLGSGAGGAFNLRSIGKLDSITPATLLYSVDARNFSKADIKNFEREID